MRSDSEVVHGSNDAVYQFYLLPMAQQINANKSSPSKAARYDDWMCLLCHNHNYSFRLICNRCHVQTKEQNTYMNQAYQQQITLAQQQLALPQPLPPHHPLYQALHSFPNVLLLMINDEPWEEQPQWREPSDVPNVKWINTLIEEVFVHLNIEPWLPKKRGSRIPSRPTTLQQPRRSHTLFPTQKSNQPSILKMDEQCQHIGNHQQSPKKG